MAQRTGTLSISMGNSRLDGTLLAIQGAANPLGAATSFLIARGFSIGSFIKVTGADGMLGSVAVFFMTSAVAASVPVPIQPAGNINFALADSETEEVMTKPRLRSENKKTTGTESSPKNASRGKGKKRSEKKSNKDGKEDEKL